MKRKATINYIFITICVILCIYLLSGCNTNTEKQIVQGAKDSFQSHRDSNPLLAVPTETGQTSGTDRVNDLVCAEKPSTGGMPGNSMSSLMNGGIYATDGEWDYILLWERSYSDSGFGLYKIDNNNNEFFKLTNGAVFSINLVEDWIYYCKNNEGIFRMKKDGSHQEQIFNGNCSEMVIVGDTILFINGMDGDKLYTADTNGKNLNILINDRTYNIQCDHDSVYYLLYNNGKYILNKSNIANTSNTEKLAEDVMWYTVYDNCIYYIKFNDNYKLYKQEIGKSESKIIYNGINNRFFIEDRKIYFTPAGKNTSIYTMNLDGSNITEYFNGSKYLIPVGEIHCVVRDIVYYEEDSEAGELIRINHDGTITMISEIIDAYKE